LLSSDNSQLGFLDRVTGKQQLHKTEPHH